MDNCIDSKSKVIFPQGGQCEGLETFLVFTTGWGVTIGILRLEARGADKHPTMHRTAPHNK